jgi:BirA family biotin operon repressor/biotin-[acetyl-CoA-carboxylase] ligase
MTGLPPRLPSAYRVVRYDTLGSTNDEAKHLARAGAEEGTVVWALEQTAGRGRRGRTWTSPRGNLYASVIVRPHCPVKQAAQLGFVAALAVGDWLCSSFGGVHKPSYKWPNDVLAQGRKIAGILLESELGERHVPVFVVVGVGVNLASSPPGVEFPATSIAELGGRVSPAEALEGFAYHLEDWAKRWREEGFAPVRMAWRAHAASLGEVIRVRQEADTLCGRFIDIDQEGALLLERAGEIRQISAAEIFPATI